MSGDVRDPGARPPRVVVAPDSFKGTHTALEVAASVASGLRESGVDATCVPLADGGEGTLEVLRGRYGGVVHHRTVTGPLGRPVSGAFLVSADGRTAVVETASASGLALVAAGELDAWNATSRGTGELVAAAAACRPEQILLGVGGSASTDGGVGAIEAILDGGGLQGARLKVLCDVTTTFSQAAVVFGPQKGADAEMVPTLTARLHAIAAGLPRDPRGRDRTGAAGGLAGGLWAQFDAELLPGIGTVLDEIGFGTALLTADAVITGEGRLDGQTTAGKVMSGVAHACLAASPPLPVHAVVGQCTIPREDWERLGLVSVTVASTRSDLVDAGRLLAGRIRAALPAPGAGS